MDTVITPRATLVPGFDARLPEIKAVLGEDDILIITADHGCDPTMPGTDHTREYVPILVYGKPVKVCDLGTRETFADLGATIADLLEVPLPPEGESFAHLIVPD